MTRKQLEHILRASANIADSFQIVVVGSQSILGAFPDAPAELTLSMEADVYPLHAPKLAQVIDGSIGEGSMFHESYGYYAQGIDEETAKLPSGWENRVVAVKVGEVVGYCLEPHDLAASKAIAGREKDREFVLAMVRHGLVDPELVLKRITEVKKVEPAIVESARAWFHAEMSRQRSVGTGRSGPRRGGPGGGMGL